MTLRRWALSILFLAAMTCVNSAKAGVWGMDPVVGILGDYSTDPALLHVRDTAVTSGAVQLDAPTTYDDGDLRFSVLPAFRVGDSRGYSSVASDYEHLNLKGEYDTERSVLSATAGIARDSSLYYDFLTSGSVGVRRDGSTADLNWDRNVTERVELDIDANSQRVLFGKTTGVATLTDYNYNSIAPTLSWNGTERSKLTLAGSVSRYNSLGSRDLHDFPTSTESRSANLQLGFVHQLSELWTLTALGGYSRALDRSIYNQYTQVGPFLFFQTLHPESAQTGSVYSANLAHQGDRLSLNASASRQLAPTGFAVLTREDTYELKASYTLSERWSFGGDAQEVRYSTPPLAGTVVAGGGDVDVRNFRLSANWNWTEHWTLTLSAARVSDSIQSTPNYSVASNELSLALSRRFNHLSFQ